MTKVQMVRSGNAPYIFIQTKLTQQTVKLLEKSTSYMKEGYEHTDKYLSGEWDGVTRLMRQAKSGSYYFPAGLKQNVTKMLQTLGYVVEVKYSSLPPPPELNLEWYGPDLYDYQEKIVTKALKELRDGNGCVIGAPTGSGKSNIACYIISQLKVRTLIIVNSKELIKQWKRVMMELLNTRPAIYGGGEEKTIGPITIATIQTIMKEKKPIANFDMITFDESHHQSADKIYKASMIYPCYYRMGLSATPDREDNTTLKIVGALGPIIKLVTPQELITMEKLVKPTLKIIQAPPGQFEGKTWNAAYKWGIAQNQQRNRLIVIEARKLESEGLQTYIHVTQIDHGHLLAGMLNCPFVHGKTNKRSRDEQISKFATGKTRILVSTLLGEGVDIPSMDAIILASGGKSPTALIQRIGRVLRTAPGKTGAIVVDFADSGRWLRQHSQDRIRVFRETYE